MALVKYGGGVIQASGSIAGTTHARNRFGNYIRARTKPVNPKSERQSAARATIQYLTNFWSTAGMSAEQRAAWATYASAISMKNRLGESVYLTGFNHFIRSNAAILAIDGDLVIPGPTEQSLPGADATVALTADAGTGLITVAFDEAQPWATETDAYLSISMGQPQGVTRNYFGGPYRIAGAIAGVDTTGAQSPATLVAPFTLTTGQKIFAYARIIRKDGRTSNPFNFPAAIVGGLLNLYNITGSTDPDFDGDIALKGAFNGKAYFRELTGKSFLWWNGSTKWVMSAALGVTGTKYQTLETASPVGTYTLVGGATGAATVAAGPGA